jgi:hypothetical protein
MAQPSQQLAKLSELKYSVKIIGDHVEGKGTTAT